MGIFSPEQGRTCKKCGFAWLAENVQKPRSPRGAGDFYTLGGWHGAGASRGATAAAKYAQKMERYNRYHLCPNCGSKKIKTHSAKGFTPTGMITRVES